jgi:hypothetical protein
MQDEHIWGANKLLSSAGICFGILFAFFNGRPFMQHSILVVYVHVEILLKWILSLPIHPSKISATMNEYLCI